MKTILTIFCVLAALFGGGCAFVLGKGAGPIALLPLAVLVLNGLILVALWGQKSPWRPAFYILGIVDVLIAVGVSIFMFSVSSYFSDPALMPFWFVPTAFALKGFLTLSYAKKVA